MGVCHDKQCIEAFIRRGVWLGLYDADDPTPVQLAEDGDKSLFRRIRYSDHHGLQQFLPDANNYRTVHPSTKSLFDFDEIWYVGTGRRVMHDGMQYDPIQGQGQGHEPLKVPWWSEIWPFSRAITSPIYNEGWHMTMDS